MTLCMLMLIGTANAQYYIIPFINAGENPGGLNTDPEYPLAGGQNPGWTTIQNGAAATPAWSSVANIPFNFSFNGTPVTQFKASTSGVLTFSTNAVAVPSYVPQSLPSANIPDNSIMAWGIAGRQTGDLIQTKVFGTAPNRQLWVHFSSYSLPSPASTNCYTYWSIVLEETTNNIYVVDMRSNGCVHELTIGIQVDGIFAYEVAGAPTTPSHAGSNALAVDNSYYQFSYGTQPTYDIKGTDLVLGSNLGINDGPFYMGGKLFNGGTETVTSFDVSYSINGGAPVTQTISGVSIPQFTNHTYSHLSAWTPSATGEYNIKMWTGNINGSHADEITANDTVYKVVKIHQVLRMILHETFTSSTCPPCTPGNVNTQNILDANTNWTSIKYQQNFPAPGNDPYFTQQSLERRNYYGINSIPRLEIDGQWDNNSNSYTQAVYDQFAAVEAKMNIYAVYDITGTAVDVEAHIVSTEDINGNLVAHIVIVEDTTYNNARTNGETIFYSVMKKMLPSSSGTSVGNLTAGNVFTLAETFDFTGSNDVENFDNLSVVVFVQNQTTKQVYQSAWGKLGGVLGVSKNSNEVVDVKVFPNPSTDGKFAFKLMLDKASKVSYEVYDVMGKLITSEDKGYMNTGMNFFEWNAGETVPSGIYNVVVRVGNSSTSKKIVINR